MTNRIDELKGRELDIAVSQALGVYFTWDNVRHYSTDLNAAWELPCEGWRWEFDEPAMCEGDEQELIVTACPPFPSSTETAVVTLADFPTSAAAYATARCRAWLKAKRQEERP